jgi:hypothetical protein
MKSCTQNPGEVIYLPTGYFHATLNIGETVSLGAVSKTDAWRKIDAERRELAIDAEKYLVPKHVDKDGNLIEGQDLGPEHEDIDSRIQKHLDTHGPNTKLTQLKARLHMKEDGMGAMKLDAQTVESKFHMAIGCDPLDAEMYAYRHAAQQPCFLLCLYPSRFQPTTPNLPRAPTQSALRGVTWAMQEY